AAIFRSGSSRSPRVGHQSPSLPGLQALISPPCSFNMLLRGALGVQRFAPTEDRLRDEAISMGGILSERDCLASLAMTDRWAQRVRRLAAAIALAMAAAGPAIAGSSDDPVDLSGAP